VLTICPDPEDPEIGRDPRRRGLTGLETRLWASPQEPLQVGATIRGYPVGCRLTAQRWTWETGDAASYSADRPGGPHPDNPAEHTYETKGAYTLRLTVQWRRETPFGSDTITRTTEEPYRVIEVRSILTG
jgi:PKD repeat protein